MGGPKITVGMVGEVYGRLTVESLSTTARPKLWRSGVAPSESTPKRSNTGSRKGRL